MIRKIILVFLTSLALHAAALDVQNTAGSLCEKVTDMNISTLTVTGTMDARDFYFIADHLHQLTTVNLHDVNIVACRTATLHYWQMEFVDGELPVAAFAGMTELTSVRLPATLKVVGRAALAGCAALTDIEFPATLDSIGAYAFAGCQSLQAVALPASVVSVGEGAFMRCTSLTSFTVPSSGKLCNLDATALMDCPALTTITPGANVTTIGERALAGTGMSSLDLTDSKRLTTMGDGAVVFSPVQEVKLPSSMQTVGDGAFLYDTDLHTITLGGNVTDISDYMLAGTGLNSDLNLDGVQTLGDYALYDVKSLSVVELPATVTYLGAYAMAGMKGLKALTSHATEVPALGENVWQGVNQSIIPLTVPEGSIELYQAAPQWQDFLFGEVTWLRGDVNGDGEVNIADVNLLVSIIQGKTVDDMTLMRGDVNEDGEINIADINLVIKIIMTDGKKVAAQVDCDDQLHMTGVSMQPGDVRTLTVTLDHADRYSAMQCDIILPAGLSLVEAQGAKGYVNETGSVDALTSRALTYSMSKRQFDGEDSGVLTITVRADAALAVESQIVLSHVVLADEDDKAWHMADCVALVTNSTGIEDLNADADRVWVEGFTLCIETRNDGIAQIAAINGTMREMQLTAGVNRMNMDASFYVVVLNGKSYKIAVR